MSKNNQSIKQVSSKQLKFIVLTVSLIGGASLSLGLMLELFSAVPNEPFIEEIPPEVIASQEPLEFQTPTEKMSDTLKDARNTIITEEVTRNAHLPDVDAPILPNNPLNGNGASGSDSSSETPDNSVNNPTPKALVLDIIANAGDDIIVDENRSITLDGSGSHDPENQSLTYVWTQLFGESILLNNVNSITPSFTSPIVANGEIKILSFELTVSDNNGRSDTDTVMITVDPINSPPEMEVEK